MWNVEFGVFLQSPEFGVWSEMRTHSCGMMDFWENCAGTPAQQPVLRPNNSSTNIPSLTGRWGCTGDSFLPTFVPNGTGNSQ